MEVLLECSHLGLTAVPQGKNLVLISPGTGNVGTTDAMAYLWASSTRREGTSLAQLQSDSQGYLVKSLLIGCTSELCPAVVHAPWLYYFINCRVARP